MSDRKTTAGTRPISLRDVDVDLWRRVKARAVEMGKTLREFVEDSLRDALRKKG